MTNQQRDDLLINLSKGLNNLQESLNQFRVEHKKDIESVNSKITAVDLKLEKTAEELRAEMAQNTNDLRAEIKAVDSKLDKTAEDLKLEIKKAIDFNNTGIIEIVHDIWAHEKKIDKRLDNHDIEIRKLNSKLA